MSKKKEDNTSVEASKQKKKGRLDGMIDAMNKRSDPLTTHKVATEYFSSFRSERNIEGSQNNQQKQEVGDATTAVYTAVTTPVTTAATDKSDNAQSQKENDISASHSGSENKVYNAIKNELINRREEETRIGLSKLKELTGLSDKTIRVAIKSLKNKKSIEITDSSKGIYGRKYFVPSPRDVQRKRIELGIAIDPVSKHIIPR